VSQDVDEGLLISAGFSFSLGVQELGIGFGLRGIDGGTLRAISLQYGEKEFSVISTGIALDIMLYIHVKSLL